MKRCPKCNFSFPDFHHVCDFDGTDLVDDPQTLPVSPGVTALVVATRSPFRRLVKSPVFLIILLLGCVFSSLLLMVYRDAARRPGSIAKSQASPNPVVSQVPPAQIGASRSEISTPQAEALSSTRERSATAPRSRTRLRRSSNRNQQTRSEIALQRKAKDKTLQKESKQNALQRDSKEDANRKDSKLTAALKTTWNILKKPFKF